MKSRQTIHSIWQILKPLFLYYILFNGVFVLLLSLCRAIAEALGEEYLTALTGHTETVTGLVSGLSMLVSVLPLLPMLRGELAEHKETVDGWKGQKGMCGRTMSGRAGLTILLAVSSALGLNVLLSLTKMVDKSAGYREVAERQYGVAFFAGVVLYGLISPITEEIVFRGLVFNRMRRYFPHMAAVIVSGVLFGIYHGNLVQGLYGGCMGILMAYLYERMHCFLIPCLFHASANITVYTASQSAVVQEKLFTIPACAALLICAAVCIFVVEKSFSDRF